MGAKSGWIRALWLDEVGFVISTELVLAGSVLAAGMVVGLSSLQDTVTAELSDLADSLSGLSQAYSYSALQGCSAETAGSYVPSSGMEDDDMREAAELQQQSCIHVEVNSSSNRLGPAPDLPLSI